MPHSTARVAIMPYEMRLGLNPAAIPLERLIWPLGVPDGIEGATLGDLEECDHLIVYGRRSVHWRLGFGTRARISIMVLEPAAIHGAQLRMLRWSYRRFYRVLGHNTDMLAKIPNGVFFPFGSTWVPQWRDLDVRKSKMISLIASNKRSQVGHVVRHRMVELADAEGLDIDVMGRGYKPFAVKADGLAPYRYSVVIENVREKNYFSEKLIDAILCRTVPIYWGCPNIGDFFDTSGMVICESEEDLHAAVVAASEADYATRAPALKAMQPIAADYGDFQRRAAEAVLG